MKCLDCWALAMVCSFYISWLIIDSCLNFTERHMPSSKHRQITSYLTWPLHKQYPLCFNAALICRTPKLILQALLWSTFTFLMALLIFCTLVMLLLLPQPCLPLLALLQLSQLLELICYFIYRAFLALIHPLTNSVLTIALVMMSWGSLKRMAIKMHESFALLPFCSSRRWDSRWVRLQGCRMELSYGLPSVQFDDFLF